jgi:hypothetical protein
MITMFFLVMLGYHLPFVLSRGGYSYVQGVKMRQNNYVYAYTPMAGSVSNTGKAPARSPGGPAIQIHYIKY